MTEWYTSACWVLVTWEALRGTLALTVGDAPGPKALTVGDVLALRPFLGDIPALSCAQGG